MNKVTPKECLVKVVFDEHGVRWTATYKFKDSIGVNHKFTKTGEAKNLQNALDDAQRYLISEMRMAQQ